MAKGSANVQLVPNIDYVRSASVTGLSQVVLLFKPHTDLLDARQQVNERLKLAIAELPKSSGMPVILQPLSSTSRVMKIGLSSKVYNQMDLSMIAYWTIKFKLMTVPGVANVPMWGDAVINDERGIMMIPRPARRRSL